MKLVYKNYNIMSLKKLNIKIGLLILLIALSMSSCDDALEEEVYSSFETEVFFETAAAAELALYGVYDILASRSLYGESYLLYFNGSTDEERFWRQNRGFSHDLLANYQIQESNEQLGLVWTDLYAGIYRSNLVIDRVTVLRDNLVDSGGTSDEDIIEIAGLNNVLGDLHFLRGFMYFQLVKTWGDVPLRLKSELSFEDLRIERTPQVEIYKQIEKDMLKGILLLPDVPNVVNTARISKTAAQGILARVYLKWAGFPVQDASKYEKAAAQAYAVVNSGYHELNAVMEIPEVGAPFDHPFPQVFKNYSDNKYDLKESMFEIHFSFPADVTVDAGKVGTWHGIKAHTNSSYKRAAPRRYVLPTFYDSFEVGDEARRDWSISQFEIKSNDDFVAVNRTKYEWGVGKFRRYLMPTKSPNHNEEAMNWPIIRYADVLLMFAESVNETIEHGGTLPSGATIDMAYEAVNKVRRRARMQDPNIADGALDLTGGAGDGFRLQLRKERSWELCFENQRRQDLIRWGILIETVRQTGTDLENDGMDTSSFYYPASTIEDKHVLMPIPFSAEISQNPDVLNTDSSNNGYR